MREALQLHDYSEEGRKKFYGTLAAVAALLARQGQVVLVPATAHRREYREAARSCAPRFIEVYLTTPHDECARRDPKGLYARALTEGLALPGVSLAYEPPLQPEVVASGGHDAEAVAQVVVRVLAHR
jgi:adenylylsulfate kinase